MYFCIMTFTSLEFIYFLFLVIFKFTFLISTDGCFFLAYAANSNIMTGKV